MKPTQMMCIAAAMLFGVFAIPVGLAAQEQQSNKLPRYAVTDLGGLGGTFSQAVVVNNKGWITGSATLPGDTALHAFLQQRGVKIDLGTLGGTNSKTQALNQAGQVIGGAESSTPDPMNENFCFFGTGLVCLPFLWQNGAISELPTLGGNNGIAFGINNPGQAGGVAENSTLDPTCSSSEFQAEPVIWDKGGIHQLATFPGDPDGFVFAINNKGQAVGASGDCWTGSAYSLHALLWQNGSVTDLGSLGGTLLTQGSAINDQGQVVGFSDLTGDTDFLGGFPGVNNHAFLWQNGVMKDLGTLPGDAASFAHSINNRGQAVGWGSRAVLWQNGVVTDLNVLVPGPPFSPLYLLVAFSINDRAEIAGYGITSSGDTHAFLAVPCDEIHADREACKDGGFSEAVETNATADANGTAARAARTHPAFGVRFGGMLERPRAEQFPGHFLPGSRIGSPTLGKNLSSTASHAR